jgi:hypothetical protein
MVSRGDRSRRLRIDTVTGWHAGAWMRRRAPDSNVTSIERRPVLLVREAFEDGALFCELHPHGRVGHLVSGEA